MAVLKANRTAQTLLSAYFTFAFNDTMLNVAGVSKDFKSFAAPAVIEPIALPPGAVVVGGDVVTDTAVAGSTAYNVKVGDSVNDARYLGSTDKTAAGRTALVPTGYVSLGDNIRVTVTPTIADSTAGVVTVRVDYIVRNRMSEVQVS